MKPFVLSALLAAVSLLQVFGQDDRATERAIQADLNAHCCKNIQVSMQNGTIRLTGFVNLYVSKVLAEKRTTAISKVPIQNEIQVSGPAIPDRQLKAAVRAAIDRRDDGEVADTSRWVSVRVKSGVVILTGHANEPTVSAIWMAVANVPGVKDVLVRVKVDDSGNAPKGASEWPTAPQTLGGVSTN
jgi:osmotically-inducible protein OsmY